MPFYSRDTYAARLTSADDSFRVLCSVAVIRDISFRADFAAGQLEGDRFFRVESLSPDDDIVSYFRSNRPDVLFLNTDVLGESYVLELTRKMKLQLSWMPRLVAFGCADPEIVTRVSGLFSSVLAAGDMTSDPIGKSKQIRAWLLTEMTGREALYGKVFECAKLFFTDLGARKNRHGLEYMSHAAVHIAAHPYCFYRSLKDLCADVEAFGGAAEAGKLVSELRTEIKYIVKNMPPETRMNVFNFETTEAERNLSELALLYKAAEIIAVPCSTILSVLRTGFTDR
ncbi:hypothetical protein SAMN02910447_01275 [Ruminococcus sp. YE71]|uniref:hypothetical protein n=1 Tax=unclassified Ruminococcus TaxID=2608920 RepID=UPI00088F010F|nr:MULTISPECIES: hypothetical protein [unclassified Ruminococcus]SDA17211.1 hypothetical protein SAMN02910446_01275 [Ruminococcus sp. YE78]SFW26497.1 hypothetical protein SAMN02910447_01275 [Ruminococcus sp. YE71]